MLTLNLVSKELRQEIKSRHIYSIIKKMGTILVIIIIAITIILLVAKIILQNNFNKVVAQTTLVTGNNKSYSAKVKKINSQINSALKVQDEFIPWTYLLEAISIVSPDDVTLSSIKIRKEGSTIAIRGLAKMRDDLLLFEKNLKDSDVFMDIKYPLQNILQKENINFEIDMKLNLEKLLETTN